MEVRSSKAIACVATFITIVVAGVLEAVTLGVSWPYRLVSAVVVGLATAGLIHAAIASPLRYQIGLERVSRRRLADEIERERAHWSLVRAGGRAIDLASDEVQVLAALAQTAGALWPHRSAQLLLCSSDGAHGTWMTSVDEHGLVPPIELDGDSRCRAVINGRPTVGDTTARLDTCPHLSGHDESSSVCIAVSTRTGPIAVLTSIGAPGDLPDSVEIDDLELLAQRAGHRLDQLSPAVAPATTDDTDIVDPLSGLPNHRTAHREIKRLIGGLTPFSLAVCDLDNFGAYNDAHGYEDGNRAIQLFAGALRSTLRPGDVICRYGDDAFLVVFPRCSSLNAQAAMERVRESMVLDASGAEISPFTCSVGVADSNQGDSIDELLDTADLALSLAKQQGGNRVRLALFDTAE